MRQQFQAGHFAVLATFAVLAVLGAQSVVSAAVLRPIGLDDFSDRAIVESFEGLMPGENIEAVPATDTDLDPRSHLGGRVGGGFLRPNVTTAFTFASGVTLEAPFPNPLAPFSVVVGDFDRGDPKLYGVRTFIVEGVEDVWDGTAYLASGGRDVRFSFPEPMYRFGFFGGMTGARLFDAQGELLLQAQLRADPSQEWFTSYEFDQPFHELELFRYGTRHVVGAERRAIDYLIVDPVPEPGSLILFIGAAALTGRTLFRSTSGGIIT